MTWENYWMMSFHTKVRRILKNIPTKNQQKRRQLRKYIRLIIALVRLQFLR